MKYVVAAALVAAGPAFADIQQTEAQGSVQETTDRLTSAIEEAGATVFTTVDHGAGAQEAGLDLPESQLVVFGNPQLGTPVMQEDIQAGLVLPLKMLVYDDGGQTYVAYEEVEDTFDDLDVDDDLDVFDQMEQALADFAQAAAGQ